MRYTIELRPGYLKAEMLGRETADETREFVEAILASLNAHQVSRVLISIRESRPIFKVEDWNLSAALNQIAQRSDLKAAFIADSKELAMSQEYIALIARQRGLAFQTFPSEPEALAWLLGD